MILKNAESPLITPTHDGSGQATHPDVIDFLNEHGMNGWGGYRYWMVMTPLPYATDTHEDANILASHDGIEWIVPEGMVNPLFDGRTPENPGFVSDTDMVYNSLTNELWVYYRYITNTFYQIHLVKVKPDMNYSNPIVVYEIEPYAWDAGINAKTRSMTIWRESATKWHMWGLGERGEADVNVYYFFSNDGIDWGEPVPCLNENGVDAIQDAFPDSYIWHFVAKPNLRERRVEFICQTRGASVGLYHMQCSMDDLKTMEVVLHEPVITPSGLSGQWDQVGVYRSAFVIEPDFANKNYIYRVWYSGIDSNNAYRIGYTEGNIGTLFTEVTQTNKGGYQVHNGVNYTLKKAPFAVFDSFSRPDNSSSLGFTETGQPWTVVTGRWGIENGGAYTPSKSSSVSFAVVDSGMSDCSLEVTIREGMSNARPRVIIRYTDNNNFLYVTPTETGYHLSRMMNGSISTLDTSEGAIEDGDVIRAVMNKDLVKIYINDVLLLSHNESFNQHATKHGMGIYDSILVRFDNFKIQPI